MVNFWRRLEKILLLTGMLLAGMYLGALLHGVIGSRIAVWKFQSAQAANPASANSRSARLIENVDVSLWSERRIQAYKESLASKFAAPLGLLRIARLRLEVPVFEGTDDLTLNRGAGRIVGTSQLGQDGNVGIAGHRDGFFRGLKDIQGGDSIELLVPNGTFRYVVRSVEIVNPDNTNVLGATDVPELTLVTCYPFYFVGSAPQRFIVHAAFVGNDQSSSTRH